MDHAVAQLLEHLDRADPGGVIGLYLHGSAAAGRLRPDSDLDLLLLVRRSLTRREREELVALLLGLSGWRGHAERFPDAAERRPLELTAVVIDRERPWSRQPEHDFQYGEWLRAELVAGSIPQPTADPDVVVLFAAALANNRVLRGPALPELIGTIPPGLLERAVVEAIPGLLESVAGDERNVLLTLARVLVTLETGAIVSKDAAAADVAPRLPAGERELLERARAGYLGLVDDDWSDRSGAAAALAGRLAERARRHAP